MLRKLAVSLQQPFQSTTHLDECLRTKNTFLALYSYVTGIKIMESLAKILQQQVQGAKQPNLASRHDLTTVNISKETDRGDKYAQSDVNISELFSHMQPYLHALTTSCTALYLCLQLLQEVGGALDIRQEQRVDISLYLPANKVFAASICPALNVMFTCLLKYNSTRSSLNLRLWPLARSLRGT